MMTWRDGMELAGAGLILLAYWANASGRWSRESARYLWVNLAGAVLLGIMAAWRGAPGFVVLEVFWIAISVAGLLRRSH